MVTRIGTFTNQQLILEATLRNQASYADTQLQVATGKKSQTFSGIAPDASRLTNFKDQLTTTQQYVNNIDTVTSRLNLMEFGLEQIDSTARDMRSLIRSNLNGDAPNTVNLAALAQQYLNQITELMNLKDGSRYLFSGSKTDTKPVDLSNGVYVTPTPPPSSATVDTGYYEGDSAVSEVRIDDNVVVQYGVTADQPAFEQIIRALNNVAQMTFTNPITPAEKQVLNDSIDTLTAAVDDNGANKTIGELAGDVTLDLNQLDAQKNQHQNYINFVTKSIGDIENVDTATAVTILNSQQVQIQASYEIIARLGNLSLTNFLK
jgi:flagellar hook-associated protein 3 FlgL